MKDLEKKALKYYLPSFLPSLRNPGSAPEGIQQKGTIQDVR